MTDWEILSLESSLVYPKEIDFGFLKKFKDFIFKLIRKRKKFVIFVGGGNLAREYQKVAKSFGISNRKDLDWIGIFTTKRK